MGSATSYGLDFAPDAYCLWRELDAELQERVLDELDGLVANPQTAEEVVRDFLHSAPGVDHCVFVRAVVDHRRSTVVLIGVTDVVRPHRT